MSEDLDDLITFASETDLPPAVGCEHKASWKVLIIDDEQEVHAVTRMVLSDFEYAGRDLQFLSAYSAAEALQILDAERDIAVALVDVVMEQEQAGLRVIRYIRDTLGDHFMRIILRTGQPGQAPEREIVQEYDINDYKEKTELTAQKLFSCIYTALGNYRALTSLEANRRGLVKVIEGSADLFKQTSLEHFLQGVLEQVTSLLFLDREAVYIRRVGVSANTKDDQQMILAATGDISRFIGQDPREVLPQEINLPLQQALHQHRSLFGKHCFTGYFRASPTHEAVVFVSGTEEMTPPDLNLLELFFRNVSIGLENLHLQKDVEETQSEIVYLLSDAVETRSNETGNHVRRVAESARELALLHGMSAAEAEILYSAAPLHDIGKIGIPDAILTKKGPLSPDEWLVMQTHGRLGARILGRSRRPILVAAAIVAEQHHENWDGSGYPAGLKGEAIHIYGRIVAIADVFDALSSERCYKRAWPMAEVVRFLGEQRGRKFDPVLTDILLEHLERFIEIRQRYPDPELDSGR